MAKLNYDSYSTYDDMLDCLSEVIEDDLKIRLSKSAVVIVLADESTDIANVKRLDIYAQVISDVMKPSTHYVTNVECTDATGLGIVNSLLHELHSRGVESEKIMSLGSDRASVMTGKHKGL